MGQGNAIGHDRVLGAHFTDAIIIESLYTEAVHVDTFTTFSCEVMVVCTKANKKMPIEIEGASQVPDED